MDILESFSGNIPQWAERVVSAWSRLKTEIDGLPGLYLRGRRVGRIPSSPTDVLSTDRLWDTSNDGTYQYTLLDMGSSVYKWDRRALNVAW